MPTSVTSIKAQKALHSTTIRTVAVLDLSYKVVSLPLWQEALGLAL
jgi:hypothetical protein